MNRVKLHHIPIYDVRFIVGVFDDHQKIEKLVYPWFGHVDVKDLAGAACNNGRQAAVLLDCKHGMSHEVIAHECFHATIRIMDWNGSKVTKDLEEPHAHLCGHITHIVYKDLTKWGVRVRNRGPFSINWTPFKK